MLKRSNRKSSQVNHRERQGARHLWSLSLAGMLMLCGCSNHIPDVPQFGPQLSGNWQFTVANPRDQSFVGGLQGGFLVQNNNSLTGNIAFSISAGSSVC